MKQTVNANEWVCTRCQTVVSLTNAPTTRRSYTFWSPRRGFSFGGGRSQSSRRVCSFCGSSSVVPAGTPRGKKILAAQGIEITGRLSARRTIGCVGIIFIFLLVMVAVSVCNRSTNPKSTQTITVPPVAEEPTEAQKAAAAQAARKAKANAVKQSSADRALQYNQDLAAKGDSYRLLRMGERYRDGDGVEKDLVKSRDYFTKAVITGNPSAAEELAKLPKP